MPSAADDRAITSAAKGDLWGTKMNSNTEPLRAGHHISRFVLCAFAALLAFVAFTQGPAPLSLRMFTLAIACLFLSVAANNVALRSPALGFQWRLMPVPARVLSAAAISLAASFVLLRVIGF